MHRSSVYYLLGPPDVGPAFSAPPFFARRFVVFVFALPVATNNTVEKGGYLAPSLE